MTVTRYFRTNDLAKAIGASVQQVRYYEASGLLPKVERSPSGYRRFTRQHLAAITMAQRLVVGYGWSWAQQMMQAIHQGKIGETLALIDLCHAEHARTREQLEQTLTALSVLTAQLPSAPAHHTERLRVAAAAQMVGVRVSALRFWEQQGLLQPSRERGSNYRSYDQHQLRRLQIVALLRAANYDVVAIRTTLDELEAGQPQRAVAATEQRRSDLARTSWRCVEAIALLHSYITDYLEVQTQ